MNDVKIYSREAMNAQIEAGFPDNTAVVCFYDPIDKKSRHGEESDYQPIDYYGICDDVYYVEVHDIDIEVLTEYGYTFESYLEDASDLAEFIKEAWNKGLDIICQCEYGQSRSAACAAAIKEYYTGNGIEVFANYNYYPNQLIFNKVLAALQGKTARNPA